MDEQLALLQFVALALPAVAILMQAVVGFHDRYGESSSDSSLRIEFRILETAFLALVAAGGLFAVSIYQQISSIITKIGIIFLAISLLLIFPATWFTLRRADFPKQSYETPEEWVKSGGVTIVKYSLVISPVIAIAIGSQFVTIPGLSDFFSDLDWRLLITVSGTGVSTLGVLVTYFQYTVSQARKERVNAWKSGLDDTLEYTIDRISNINLEERNDITKLASLAEDAEKEIEGIRLDHPQGVESETLNQLKDIEQSFGFIKQSCEEYLHTIDEIERFERNREEAVERKASLSEQLSSESELDEESVVEKMDTLKRSEDYLEKVSDKLKHLNAELEETRTVIEAEIDTLEDQIDELELE